LLSFEIFELSTLLLDLTLLLFKLALLLSLLRFLALHLIAHHRTGHTAKGAANGRTRPRAADHCPNNRAGCRTQACPS
jgi:hypothetical protein